MTVVAQYASKDLGLDKVAKGDLDVFTPITGKKIASIEQAKASDMPGIAAKAQAAFLDWRSVPAPKRGELVRLFGEELRKHKQELGKLVSVETGKILSEGLGEVQEMIDTCDAMVGQARQLSGFALPSERKDHKLSQVLQPMSPVGIITAFNFPVAVWSWNAMPALIAGDSVVWKPSEKTPLTAIAVQNLFNNAVKAYNAAGNPAAPENLSQVVIGGRAVGEAMVDNKVFKIISATGSTRMGEEVGQRVAKRFGRSILELGGNNATLVMPSAVVDEILEPLVFGAVGTAGQRCTTLRRLIVDERKYDELVPRMVKAYEKVGQYVGDPLDDKTLVGPVISEASLDLMDRTLERAVAQGGKILAGGQRIKVEGAEGGYYVTPAIVEMPDQTEVVMEESFVPILYVMKCNGLRDGIDKVNATEYGLSSSICTRDIYEAEEFLSAKGSEAGIANVNIGTSGAEIGGAFGGNGKTGGGREVGPRAYEPFMRWQTQTVRCTSEKAELSQGVKFDLG